MSKTVATDHFPYQLKKNNKTSFIHYLSEPLWANQTTRNVFEIEKLLRNYTAY